MPDQQDPVPAFACRSNQEFATLSGINQRAPGRFEQWQRVHSVLCICRPTRYRLIRRELRETRRFDSLHAALLEPASGARIGETCSARFELSGQDEEPQR